MNLADPAIAALKGRRRKSVATPELPETHQDMPAAYTRRNPLLFDPAEMPTVLEMGGPPQFGDHSEFYVIADQAATESVIPDGCTTAVSRTLWTAGQHVRRDIYATYLKTLENQDDDTATTREN
jgi:hypothetical protein